MRLRVADEGTTIVKDVIRGESAFENALQDDLVIARADGTPVYHLAVVVDDLDMGVTHVVRGADHYSNTPEADADPAGDGGGGAALRARPAAPRPRRQEALQAPRSRLCAGTSRSRVPTGGRAQLRRAAGMGHRGVPGVLHHRRARSSEFSLERVSKSPAVFDEQKLRHINGRYLRELGVDDLTARLEALTGREGLRGAVEISQEKISTLSDFWPLAGFFFDGPADDPAAREKIAGLPGGARAARAWPVRRSPRWPSRGATKPWKPRCRACWSARGRSRGRSTSRSASRSPEPPSHPAYSRP